MNVRETSKLFPNYFEINREERNYAAIFFTALCQPGNTEKFLEQFTTRTKIGSEFGIYFEYSYLRDLWNCIKDQEIKKEILRNHLKINDIDNILSRSSEEINSIFGVAGTPSSEQIQYPGKWAIIKYQNNFKDNDDFLQICRFKWSFNIKPDIVIHLDKNTAICIEAKYESVEGYYPSMEKEKIIFRERKIKYIGQTELHKFMMEELLGIKTDFLFLVQKKEKSATHQILSWKDAFNSIDIDMLPNFALEMIKKI